MPGDRLVQPVEAGPLVTTIRAAHALIAELAEPAPAAPLNGSLQVTALVLDRLLAGADAQVKGNRSRMAHGCAPSLAAKRTGSGAGFRRARRTKVRPNA